MALSSSESLKNMQELGEFDPERAAQAHDFYFRLCEEVGLKVVSWDHFQAWKDYVDGRINESELNTEARSELHELSRSFGKYIVVDKTEERKQLKEEEEQRRRAKEANKIYRRVCSEVGFKISFFQDFSSWSDYVEGKITEAQFYERAKLEVTRMLARLKSETR
jgi:hypothetical protein